VRLYTVTTAKLPKEQPFGNPQTENHMRSLLDPAQHNRLPEDQDDETEVLIHGKLYLVRRIDGDLHQRGNRRTTAPDRGKGD